MYVIGTDEISFIRKHIARDFENIAIVDYNLDMICASHYEIYEDAKKDLDKIIRDQDVIFFKNCDVIDSIIKRRDGIKFEPENLKIFELVAFERRE